MLTQSMAGFVAGERGDCQVGTIDAQPFALTFTLNCTLDTHALTGNAVMTYAKDGKSTNMELKLTSGQTDPAVTFSRSAQQKFLRSDCPAE